MIKTINLFSFIICNFIAVNLFSQDLQLSFSEHVPYESNYKAIRCVNYKSGHILFMRKKKSKHCNIKVHIFDEDFKNKNQFNFIIDNEKLVGVRLLFDNIVLFTSDIDKSSLKLGDFVEISDEKIDSLNNKDLFDHIKVASSEMKLNFDALFKN